MSVSVVLGAFGPGWGFRRMFDALDVEVSMKALFPEN